MKTLSSLAHGYADTLITRSAICMLKEGKPLIVVPRETPIDLIGLKNMVHVSEAGGIVLPAAPGFYHQPSSISELINFIVGKILDQLSLSHDLFKRWGGKN
jgi:4-hydroxy-3-polyprenylbenzoate decarboxylase